MGAMPETAYPWPIPSNQTVKCYPKRGKGDHTSLPPKNSEEYSLRIWANNCSSSSCFFRLAGGTGRAACANHWEACGDTLLPQGLIPLHSGNVLAVILVNFLPESTSGVSKTFWHLDESH